MKENKNEETVLLCSGSHTMFVNIIKGSTYVTNGHLVQNNNMDSLVNIEDTLDDILYSKPVAFYHKMVRKVTGNYENRTLEHDIDDFLATNSLANVKRKVRKATKKKRKYN